jgi:uncharacterized protein
MYVPVRQKFVVGPNELAKEKQFIEYNIKYTRDSYNLNKIEEKVFNYDPNLSSKDILKDKAVYNNLRLWDPRPLKTTLGQIQSIRLYYDFNDVDIDRYTIKGEKRQVMLAARELFYDGRIPARARNWINEHLKFTHGYGVAMCSVSEVMPGGMPKLIIKDIPPKSEDIIIKQPAIYFGEKTDAYIFVNTSTDEFDYPEGDKNKYTRYSGPGGIKIDSLWRKILYASYFKDFKILFTNYLKKGSRLFYFRRFQDRIGKIAPFIHFDPDAYLVISKSGDLFWIIDGYTMDSEYPYAEPFEGRLNYIRNSVKAVVNAYTGEVKFYISEEEPLVNVFAKIFPELFLSFDEFPEDLKEHLRYPENLFRVQAGKYRAYHMTEPQVFYNQEDLWDFPLQKTHESGSEFLQPYYALIRLPGHKEPEYLIMIPFTPAAKNNMIGWLAARCDGENYGKLLIYRLPKQNLIYGPMQIEARIDQDSEISKELSLWGQKGSEVFRGNLLVVPVKNSFLFVEPIYLQATSGQIPELKKIVVASGESLGMGNTLEEALQSAFSKQKSRVSKILRSPEQLAQEAARLYRRAKAALKAGEWSKFGQQFDSLDEVLKKMDKD